jgi:hypothetical protein
MLKVAVQGYPELIRAYLLSAPGTLDTFSRRCDLHRYFLQSLALFSDFQNLASEADITVDLLRHWVTEAYAVVSVGFPSDVEAVVLQNPQFDRGFLSQIRQARSRASHLLKTDTGTTLEQETSRILELWSLGDTGNELIALHSQLRSRLLNYLQGYFNLKYKSLKALIQGAMRDSLDYLMTSE